MKSIEELKREDTEKTLILYMLFRNEFELKLKEDFKIANNEQLHEYAFNKLITENLL